MLNSNDNDFSPVVEPGIDNRNQSSVEPAYPISPLKLARLNFSLFSSLYTMGVDRERICSVMLIDTQEFDYIRELGGFLQTA